MQLKNGIEELKRLGQRDRAFYLARNKAKKLKDRRKKDE